MTRHSVLALAALGALACASGASAQNVKEMQLAAAAQDCRAAEVDALLRQGVDANARNSGGYTPMMLAAGNGCREVVQRLLDHGADPSIAHDSFGNAAAQAKMNGHSAIVALIAGGGAAKQSPARQAPLPKAPKQATAPAPAGGVTARGWPKLGAYKVGQEVLYSGTAGKTWDSATVKSIDPTYGYNFQDVTGSTDAYFVVGAEREPFWTEWFVGDWRVSVPMAMGTVTDGRNLYRTVSGGMRLPPLRINGNGTYSWRVSGPKGEQLIQGRWEPVASGPGVVLKKADKGADWHVYNNSRTGSQLGETVILSSTCCSHYDGSRLK